MMRIQAYAPKVASRAITLPAAWDALLAEAEAALGAHGDACTIASQ